MNLRILNILLKKELCLLKRNPFIPRMLVALPVMAMLILPLVANLDVKNVGVAVVDNDRSELSRRIIADMDASDYINVVGSAFLYEDALRTVEDGGADVIVVIPEDYSADLVNNLAPQLSVDANGVNATTGMLGAQYASASAMNTVAQWKLEHGMAVPRQQVEVLDLYNPTLDFRNYMIPALMVVLIIIICGFLPTLNLVSEKETGTIEAMNVTPVGKFTFVLSKLIPYWIVGIMVVTIGMLIGRFVYGLAPCGRLVDIYVAAILFSLVMSGLGVTIANKSATILQSIFVMFAFIVVFQLMGGLFTPISSMPVWAQYITYAVPPRYFIEIMRSVYLKGAVMSDLWTQYAALLGYALLLCTIAAVTYKKRS